jgi:hypothetical protein
LTFFTYSTKILIKCKVDGAEASHGSLFLHLKLNSLNYCSRKAFCTIRSYQTTRTLATPTRLPLSKMLSAPGQVLFQKKLTNFQKLLFIYNKSMKNGYYRSKKPKLFYFIQYNRFGDAQHHQKDYIF